MTDLVDLVIAWARERRALSATLCTLASVGCLATAWQACAGP